MLRSVPVVAAMLLVAAAVLGAGPTGERYIVLEVKDRGVVPALAQLVSIDTVRDGEVRAYAVPEQLAELGRRGYSWQELPHPGANPRARMDLERRKASGDWDAYPSYPAYVSMMEAFADEHPEYCRLHVIGSSTNTIRPHQLLAVKISDHPDQEDDEPEVFLTSSIHGDETVGFVVLLRLIDELLDSHTGGTTLADAGRLRALVDNLEIWINPLANPDGTYYSGDANVDYPVRFLVNADGTNSGVDGNRNFPDPAIGDHPDGNPWWRETVAMMELAEQQSFILSVNFHGGIEVVNYPWETWAQLHADNAWFISISRAYASQAQQVASAAPYFDSGYMRSLNNGITNGYAWYQVHGGRQDFMTYWHGCRETTIEISSAKNPPGSELPAYWHYNRLSILAYMERALEGVRGVVRSEAGAPLAATVREAWHDTEAQQSQVYTDPDVGDYHRMLLPGAHWLVFEAQGFVSQVQQVVVAPGPAARLDVVLEAQRSDTCVVQGTVSDARSSEPIAGARLRMIEPDEIEVFTGADGGFAFPPVSEGACLVEVSAEGYATSRIGHQATAPLSVLDTMLEQLAPQPRSGGLRAATIAARSAPPRAMVGHAVTHPR